MKMKLFKKIKKDYKFAICSVIVGILLATAGFLALGKLTEEKAPNGVFVSNYIKGVVQLSVVEHQYTVIDEFNNSNEVDLFITKVNVPFTKKHFIGTFTGTINYGFYLGEMPKAKINDITKTVTFDIPEIYRLSHTIDDKSLKYFDEETNIFNPISIKDGDKFRADHKKDAEQQDIKDGVLDYVHTETQKKMEMIVHAKFDTYKDYKVKCNFTKQDTIKDKPKTNFAGKTIKE